MALIRCRECRRQVSTEAVACPHCGAPVPPSSQAHDAPRQAAAEDTSKLVILLIVTALLGAGGLAAAQWHESSKPKPGQPRAADMPDVAYSTAWPDVDKRAASPISSTRPTVSRERAAQCAGVISRGISIGLIRARPAANRIDVEDAVWAAMAADVKRIVAIAVLCDMQATGAGVERFSVVYGYRSGRRLALADQNGATLE